jgi:hypothetical protein
MRPQSCRGKGYTMSCPHGVYPRLTLGFPLVAPFPVRICRNRAAAQVSLAG